MAIGDIRTLRADFMLAEAPRWHDDRLWVSDMNAREVVAVDLDGGRETIVQLPGRPCGLGWPDDGSLVVASMRDATLVRVAEGGVEPLVSLGASSPVLNDLVAAGGRVYVGGMPDLFSLVGEAGGPSALEISLPKERLYLVEVGDDGVTSRVVADGVDFPNGAAITPDGAQLILAETMAHRLVAFDIEADGSLVNRRVWADLDDRLADGICLDAEGCVWVAVPEPAGRRGFLRVGEGGAILDGRPTEHPAVAVALGGPAGTDLFMVEATELAVSAVEQTHTRGNSRVTVGTVDVPGAAAA